MMKTRLDIIEARLQAFIESSAQLFPWSSPQHALARRLVEAMQESLTSDENGQLSAAHFYTIYLNPQDFAFWQSNQELFDDLARALQEAAMEAGVNFSYPPMIRLAENPDLPRETIQIVAALPADIVGETAALTIKKKKNRKQPVTYPANAFLIVDGTAIFPLRQAVVNIGRRSDNHLVIDDPRVSRAHAQLRVIHGHYVIFDLNSTGGTLVNGQRISQCTLKPGDVISIAGIPVIYGEDVTVSKGETGEYIPGKAAGSELQQGEP